MKRNLDLKRLCATLLIVLAVLAVPLSLVASEGAPAAKSTVKSPAQLININTADVSKLSTLPGIGPSIAERIVKFRKQSGAFKSPQDLGKVKGIGEKKLAKVIKLITVK